MESQGLDFDAIVQGASQHFTSPQIIRCTEPLTSAELDLLFKDDQRA